MNIVYKFFLGVGCLIYAFACGVILELARIVVLSFNSMTLPAFPHFVIYDLYSDGLYSAYCTYIELMIIPFLIAITAKLLFKKLSSYRVFISFFCIETMLLVTLLAIILLPLYSGIMPDQLVTDELKQQTKSAYIIHGGVIALILLFIAVAYQTILNVIKAIMYRS